MIVNDVIKVKLIHMTSIQTIPLTYYEILEKSRNFENILHSIQFPEVHIIWQSLLKNMKNIPKLIPINTEKRTQYGQNTSLQFQVKKLSILQKIVIPCKKRNNLKPIPN